MNENEETYWDRVRRIEHEQNVSVVVALRVARDEEKLEAARTGPSTISNPDVGERCGECRLGLGAHRPDDPQCAHHVAGVSA